MVVRTMRLEKEVEVMEMKVKKMSYKEAYKHLLETFVMNIGSFLNFMLKIDEKKLVDYLKEEAQKFEYQYNKSFSPFGRFLTEAIPDNIVFPMKIKKVVEGFQFFLGVGNLEILEISSKEGLIQVKQCLFKKVVREAPQELNLKESHFCNYQCKEYLRELCEKVFKIGIDFHPQEKGCILKVKSIKSKS